MGAVAFCPSPPLLVLEVGVGADADLEELRTRCREAVASLVADDPEVVIVLGDSGPGGDETARGTFAPWGVAREVGGSAAPTLGLAHSVGGWLLDEAGWTGARRYVVPGELDALPDGAALLVVGDGSATRTPKAPGSYDPAGEVFDETVTDAMRSGDPARLQALDAGPRLLVQGVEAWHEAGRLLAGRTYGAAVLADQAPFGVGYFVAVWTARS